MEYQYRSSNCNNIIKQFLSTSKSTSSSSSIQKSLRMLSLTKHFTAKELRDAYFESAKRCHPDVQPQRRSLHSDHMNIDQKAESTNMFLEITEAYEELQKYIASGRKVSGSIGSTTHSNDDYGNINENELITKSEEHYYREAVKETLGIDADVLEESKKCPMFRLWLKGGSHMAFHYNIFLMRHGGLAQMLPTKEVAKISEGTYKRRRRR